MINAQNCLHCKTCDIKDPTQNIDWTVPEVPVACGGLLLRSLRFAFARSTHIIVNLTPQNLIIVILSATSAAAHASSLSALTRLSGWRRPCLFRNVILHSGFKPLAVINARSLVNSTSPSSLVRFTLTPSSSARRRGDWCRLQPFSSLIPFSWPIGTCAIVNYCNNEHAVRRC